MNEREFTPLVEIILVCSIKNDMFHINNLVINSKGLVLETGYHMELNFPKTVAYTTYMIFYNIEFNVMSGGIKDTVVLLLA